MCPTSPSLGSVGIETNNQQPATGDSPLQVRPDFPISPEFLELRDIRNSQGEKAEALRFTQLERNRASRDLRTNRKRYIDLALRLNLKTAAEQLADRKLAEKLKRAGMAPAPQLAYEAAVADGVKKMQAFEREVDACLAGQEVQIA